MLIRSQNKMSLANYNAGPFLEILNIFSVGYSVRMKNEEEYLELGRYSTKEKALKVLDMIQEEYTSMRQVEVERYGQPYFQTRKKKVFEMPQDNEVD